MGNEVSKTSRRGFIGGALAGAAALVWPFGKAKAEHANPVDYQTVSCGDICFNEAGIEEVVCVSTEIVDIGGIEKHIPHYDVRICGGPYEARCDRMCLWVQWAREKKATGDFSITVQHSAKA